MRTARLKERPAARLGLLMPLMGLAAPARLDLRLLIFGRDGETCVLIWILGGGARPPALLDDGIDISEEFVEEEELVVAKEESSGGV